MKLSFEGDLKLALEITVLRVEKFWHCMGTGQPGVYILLVSGVCMPSYHNENIAVLVMMYVTTYSGDMDVGIQYCEERHLLYLGCLGVCIFAWHLRPNDLTSSLTFFFHIFPHLINLIKILFSLPYSILLYFSLCYTYNV